MKQNILILILAFVLSSVYSGTAQTAATAEDGVDSLSEKEKSQGWTLLFNGHSFDGWRGINKTGFPDSGWKVDNGMIRKLPERGGDIITEKKYGRFILDWEWKMITPGGNSGLKYFVNERSGDTGGYGYGLEYQILDDKQFEWMRDGKMKPNDYHTMGALYEIYPPSPDKRVNPVGEWNKSRIVCKQSNTQHWLNGSLILKYKRGSRDFRERIAESKFKDVKDYGLFPDGHILLQDHNSEILFRNIKIKSLD